MADRFGPRRVLSMVVVFWFCSRAHRGAWNWARWVIGFSSARRSRALPAWARRVFLDPAVRARSCRASASRDELGRLSRCRGRLAHRWAAGSARSSRYVGGFRWAVPGTRWFRDEPSEHRDRPAESTPSRGTARGDGGAASEPDWVRTLLGAANLWSRWQYFCSNSPSSSADLALSDIKTPTLDSVEAGFYTMRARRGAAGNIVRAGSSTESIAPTAWTTVARLPLAIGFALAAADLWAASKGHSLGRSVAGARYLRRDMTLPPSWAFCVDIGGGIPARYPAP